MATETTQEATAAIELAEIQRKNALMDNLNAIPPFDGDSSSTPITDFIEKLESIGTFFSWDDNEKRFALISRLSGNAARVVKSHKHKGYEELLGILKQRFVRTETPDVALSKFLNYKQQPGMSVSEFYERAHDLSLKALVVDGVESTIIEKSREAMFFSMLLSNLAPEIRKGVITKDPKTSREVLECALLEEKACRSINPFYQYYQGDEVTPQKATMQLACAAPIASSLIYERQTREIEGLKEKLELLTSKLNDLAVERKNVTKYCYLWHYE